MKEKLSNLDDMSSAIYAADSQGPTWGVTGEQFLVGYLLLAILSFVLILIRRWVNQPKTGDINGLSGTEVAYLVGGKTRAVLAALVSLRHQGLLESDSNGILTARGKLPDSAEPLEIAIWEVIWRKERRRARELPIMVPVRRALSAIEPALAKRGLWFGSDQRRARRVHGIYMNLILVLGIVRLISGLIASKPVLYLIAELAMVSVMSVFLFSTVGGRTRVGNAYLASAHRRYGHLRHLSAAGNSLYTPRDAALAVGLFGAAAFVAVDPTFVADAQLSSINASGYVGSGSTGSSSGDSGGSSGGGCGSSSSSCGGGGGGGGGGCGG